MYVEDPETTKRKMIPANMTDVLVIELFERVEALEKRLKRLEQIEGLNGERFINDGK